MEEKEIVNNISPFKSMLQEDLDIFVNIEEMGESVLIADKKYTAVLEFPEKDFSFIEDGFAQAISLIVYVRESKEFEPLKTGNSLKINNTFYIINNTFIEEGLRVFKLTENVGA